MRKILLVILLIAGTAQMSTLSFPLQPKQSMLRYLIEDGPYSWLGYGGARGGAKSHAIRDLALYFGFKYGTYSLVFRRYSTELLDNHINPMLAQYPQLRKLYNKTEKILYHPQGFPILRFGYAENEAEIYKFQGTSYPIIFVDEATQSTQAMLEWLRSSLRDPQGRLPSKAKFVMTMNPGGAGHIFIKRIFVDKSYQGNESPEDYYFIQSHVWDNVVWCARKLHEFGYTVENYYNDWTEQQRIDFTIKHSDYAKNLAGLPEQLMKAYLYGDWEVFGGMFFKGFDKAKQVIKPFVIPPEWELVGSMDPGFASPLSFGIHARDFKGTIHRVATYYAKDNIPNHAAAVKKWLTSEHSPIRKYTRGRIPGTIVAGLDAFSKLDRNAIVNNDETVAGYFEAVGLTLQKAKAGPNTRIENWWRWKSLFPDKYLIFDGFNEPLVTQITSTPSDDRNPEDIKGRGNSPDIEDHCLDEAKYGVAAIHVPIEKPVDNRPKWLQKLEADNRQSKKTVGFYST